MSDSLRPNLSRSAPPGLNWRLSTLLWAPHRLAFFMAISLWLVASLWWAAVLVSRAFGMDTGPMVLPHVLTHAALMVLGVFPLFFSGFLFTAGPKWLNQPAPHTQDLMPMLVLQGVGWLMWLIGGAISVSLAAMGVALVALGHGWMTVRLGALIRLSTVPDRLHARWIHALGWVHTSALGVVAAGVLREEAAWALQAVELALWWSVSGTFVVVIHRMLPFFTASALPGFTPWRPRGVLAFLLGVLGFEGLIHAGLVANGVTLPSGVWQGLSGLEWLLSAGLLGLAVRWGLGPSLQNRLLGMLHLGVLWLAVAVILSATDHWGRALTGVHGLGLGPVHALSMGFLGSVTFAMVTRVSLGHGGRGLVVGNRVWRLFGLLQVATLLRIGASLSTFPSANRWLAAAALLWLLALAGWSCGLLAVYGRPRADGQPG